MLYKKSSSLLIWQIYVLNDQEGGFEFNVLRLLRLPYQSWFQPLTLAPWPILFFFPSSTLSHTARCLLAVSYSLTLTFLLFRLVSTAQLHNHSFAFTLNFSHANLPELKSKLCIALSYIGADECSDWKHTQMLIGSAVGFFVCLFLLFNI